MSLYIYVCEGEILHRYLNTNEVIIGYHAFSLKMKELRFLSKITLKQIAVKLCHDDMMWGQSPTLSLVVGDC
jgi:hypothetical protein